jgi:demethylmenaquinone methyltransferase/2-methoxy-6-polyprenyl-1,4-benzoquinol methylase
LTQLNGETKAKSVATMFARISERYDLMNTIMTGGAHYRWRNLAAKLATEGLPSGPALDVATGTGDLAFALTHRPEVKSVVGLDFVPEMLNLAKKKERHSHLRRPVTWSLGDALALPFPDNTFICATSGFAMRNVADQHQALSEMARVVLPGGRVTILELTPADSRLSRLLASGFSRISPLLGQLLADDRSAYTYLPRSVETFPTARELSRLMENAGLKNVRYRLLGMGLVALHTGEAKYSQVS